MRFERTERRRTPNSDGESPGDAGSGSVGDSQSKAVRAAARWDKTARGNEKIGRDVRGASQDGWGPRRGAQQWALDPQEPGRTLKIHI